MVTVGWISVATLVMSKAMLGSLLLTGETVRNELSGATIASRIKEFIFEHSGMKFDECTISGFANCPGNT